MKRIDSFFTVIPARSGKMDRSSFRSGMRKSNSKPDIYSTFVVHDDEGDDDDGVETNRRRKSGGAQPHEDPYATMVYKDNGREDDDDDEYSSLPPLLKRLPTDFGGGAPLDYDDDDDDDDDAGDFGTVIVKSDRRRHSDRPSSSLASPPWKSRSSSQASPLNRFGEREDDGDEEDGSGGFSTFVVRSTVKSGERESVSGTVVRRSSGGSGGVGSTMERAVASMQGMGDFGFGKQRKGSGSSQNDEGRHHSITTKVSTSSIPESITREDPTIKYELLNELGRASRVHSFNFRSFLTLQSPFFYFSFLLCFSRITNYCGVCVGDVGLQGRGPMELFTKQGI